MHFISGRASELGANTLQELFSYRHNVFVDTLKWPLATDGVHEVDQYDREDTIYVVARNESAKIVGTARLLPTARPYMLKEIFPELMSYTELPQSNEVWELSRFAAIRVGEPGENGQTQFFHDIAVSLLTETIRCASRYGARKLVMVTNASIERLTRRSGFHAVRCGIPQKISGEWVTSFMMNLPDATLAMNGSRYQSFVDSNAIRQCA